MPILDTQEKHLRANRPPRRSARLTRLADGFGATASFLCAAHCALLPLAVAALPFIGLSFLADHAYERGFVLFACALASTMSALSVRRHGDRRTLALLLPGIALLLVGIAADVAALSLLHAALLCSGGVLLALTHATNLRLTRWHDATCTHAAST